MRHILLALCTSCSIAYQKPNLRPDCETFYARPKRYVENAQFYNGLLIVQTSESTVPYRDKQVHQVDVYRHIDSFSEREFCLDIVEQ